METLAVLYPAEFWFKVVPYFLAYVLASLAPLLAALCVAVRQKLPRKVLFVFLIPSLVYGGLLFLYVLVWLPLEVFAVRFAPELKGNNLPYGAGVGGAYGEVGRWAVLWLPACLAIAGVALSIYLGRRWPALVQAVTENRQVRSSNGG